VLTETVTSPTLAHQLQALFDMFPEAKWHQYEPVNRDYVYAGARRAFAENVTAQYRFDQAQIILALDADYLACGPAIVFGNINDLNSRVSKLKATQLNYGLLTDLNTRPRTTYLARLRHPHPDLAQHEEHS
jgi:hypothetical protein